MASQNKNKQAELNQNKKAAVLGQEEKKPGGPKMVVAAVVIALAAAVGAYMVIESPMTGADVASSVSKPTGSAPAASQEPAAGGPQVTADSVSFTASEFEDGKARYYSFEAPGGITVRFFVVKSTDGVIRAAFDACDVCWRAGKGYAQEGDVMVCRNCGRKFATDKVNEIKGGCNPAPLNRSMENGKVVITQADIAEGKRYFDFGAKG